MRETRKLTRRQVAERYGGVTIRTIERWTADPRLNFPQPVRYGHKSLLYDLNELIEWDRARAQAQAKPQAKAKAIDLAIDLDDLIEEAAAA